ncbi:MAG: long-chain fatty acid--CoA ligase [Bacteroidia bacterium]|nr:long-chain fatty acid--CoA ligase [Bacteroidia bacterium]
MQKVTDILFLEEVINKPNLLNYKENKEWKSLSGKEFYTKVFQLAAYLNSQNINKGDRVLLMSENRPEWNIVDFACQLIGAVTVPVFPNISENDLSFILNESQPRLAFISTTYLLKKYHSLLKSFFDNKIVLFNRTENALFIDDILKTFNLSEIENKLISIYKTVQPNDLLTLLYTSGTSGQPKGVMLSHQNLLSNVLNCQHIAPFQKHWKALSFLPLNHVYERMVNTLLIYKAVSIYYAEGIEKVVDNIKEVKPHLFVSVPRLIERVYQKITSTRDTLKGLKKHILAWAIALAENYELHGKNGWWYEFQRKIADKLVYKKWREALGGNIECMISGGAALNPKMERMFLCARINCMQGYGLTETSPVVAVNTFDDSGKCIGTVGPIIPNTQVKIADDGEILVKGPGVMMGYYKNPTATAEVIDNEEWFHTGDIGEWVDNRFLKITDRKKGIFKTTAGKYISPAYIENKLKEHPFIEHCMVIGANEKFPSALITLNIKNIQEKFPSLKKASLDELANDKEIKKTINDFVQKVNKELAPYEQIRKPYILNTQWSVESGELTPKMSLKRKFILEKYQNIVDSIYRSNDV